MTLTAGYSETQNTSYSSIGALPTASRNSIVATSTRTVTFNANGGTIAQSIYTSTAQVTTAYALNG
jgi:hypothetical protein